jgi:mRNA interferase YafQ
MYLSTQFKKDYKRYKHQSKKIQKLTEVLKLLASGKPISQEYKPHPLIGQYKGCLECHIEGDFLLIWIDEEDDTIELV